MSSLNSLTVNLYRVVDGVKTLLGTYAIPSIIVGAAHTYTLQVRNNTKKVLVDGVVRVTSTDNYITDAGSVAVLATTSDSNGVPSSISLDRIYTDPLTYATADSITLPMLQVVVSDTSGMPLPLWELTAETEGSFVSIPLITLDGGTNDALLTLPMFGQNLGGQNAADVTLPVWEVTGSGSADYAWLNLPSLIVSGDIGNDLTADLSLPLIGFSASGLTGFAFTSALTLPMLTVSVYGQDTVDASIPLWTTDADLLAGEIGDADNTLPSLDVAGTHYETAIYTSDVSLPILATDAYVVTGSYNTVALTLSAWLLAAEGVTGTISTGEVSIPVLTLDASGYPQYVGTVNIELPMLVLESAVYVAAVGTYKTFAINTRTLGLTEYQGLSINSFAKFNGVTLAATPTGIVALTGSVDGTAIIDASAKLARMHFGYEQLKRVKDVFVSYRSDSAMVLTVDLEGDTQYQYTIEPRGTTGLRNSRAKLGRKLKSKYWQLGLKNVDGADFDVDSMAFEPQELERKLG